MKTKNYNFNASLISGFDPIYFLRSLYQITIIINEIGYLINFEFLKKKFSIKLICKPKTLFELPIFL